MRNKQTEKRLIGTMEVAEKIHCHPMSIPRMVKQKKLPPPVKPFGRNLWDEDEIDKCVEARIAASAPGAVRCRRDPRS